MMKAYTVFKAIEKIKGLILGIILKETSENKATRYKSQPHVCFYHLSIPEKPKNVKMLELKGEVYEMEVEDWVSEEDCFLSSVSSTLLVGSETRPSRFTTTMC